MVNNRLAYGLAKAHGIDTIGMSPKEVWEALEGKGITPEKAQKQLQKVEERKREELKKKFAPNEEDIKPFINIQLFARNYSGWQSSKLRKSIRSHKRTIALHEDKITNSQKYIEQWENLTEERKEKYIKNWKSEIFSYNRDISRIKKELEKRGEDYEN